MPSLAARSCWCAAPFIAGEERAVALEAVSSLVLMRPAHVRALPVGLAQCSGNSLLGLQVGPATHCLLGPVGSPVAGVVWLL